MKKKNKLYNVLFPVWFLFIYPIAWIVIIPANFLIDSLVLIMGMFILKLENKKQFYKRSILKVFIFGFLADIIGALFLFVMVFLLEIGITGDEIYLTLPAVLLSGVMIFIFNYFITFKKENKNVKFKLALILTLITAPYAIMIPLNWIY